MIIRHHPKYLTHLAKRYLSIYGLYGYEEAKKWHDTFLDADHRKKLGPYIHKVAEEQGLTTEE